MKAKGGIGKRWEIRGDQTLRRQSHHPTQAHIYGETMGRRHLAWEGEHPFQRKLTCATGGRGETRGNKGRQADTPSNTGTHMWEDKETMGDKTSGKPTQHLTQAHMWETMEHKRRQEETRPRGHIIQHPAHM